MTIVKYPKDAPFSDLRPDKAQVALEFSPNFDPNKPAVMMVYLHGHGFALERDLAGRQNVVEQFRQSGVNGVLVAPQMMYDSKGDSPTANEGHFRGYPASYAGSLQEQGGPQRFLKQTAIELSKLSGIPPEKFDNMPVVMNAYSGGGVAAARILAQALADKKDQTLLNRIKGVNLMDAMFSGSGVFADYANKTTGFINNRYIATTYDKEGTPRATQTSIMTADMQSFLTREGASRVNNEKITGIGHTALVEGNDKVAGAFTNAMKIAALQGYSAPSGPAVAQGGPLISTAQAEPIAPQSQIPLRSLSSWVYEKMHEAKEYFFPPAKPKTPSTETAQAEAAKTAAQPKPASVSPVHVAETTKPAYKGLPPRPTNVR